MISPPDNTQFPLFMTRSLSLIIYGAVIVLAGWQRELIILIFWTPIQVKGSFLGKVLAISRKLSEKI